MPSHKARGTALLRNRNSSIEGVDILLKATGRWTKSSKKGKLFSFLLKVALLETICG